MGVPPAVVVGRSSFATTRWFVPVVSYSWTAAAPNARTLASSDDPDELCLHVLDDLLGGVAAGRQPPLQLGGLAAEDGYEVRVRSGVRTSGTRCPTTIAEEMSLFRSLALSAPTSTERSRLLALEPLGNINEFRSRTFAVSRDARGVATDFLPVPGVPVTANKTLTFSRFSPLRADADAVTRGLKASLL